MVKTVTKPWGSEDWIVNDEYCGKFLNVKQEQHSSYHSHKTKKETLLVLNGAVYLYVEGEFRDASKPVTIYPGQKHFFSGITDSRILEISTHHEESDTERSKWPLKS